MNDHFSFHFFIFFLFFLEIKLFSFFICLIDIVLFSYLVQFFFLYLRNRWFSFPPSLLFLSEHKMRSNGLFWIYFWFLCFLFVFLLRTLSSFAESINNNSHAGSDESHKSDAVIFFRHKIIKQINYCDKLYTEYWWTWMVILISQLKSK